MDNPESSARDHRTPAKTHDDASAHSERHETSESDSTISKAKELWYKAEQWTVNNPFAWSHLVRICLREAEHKRKFGTNWAIEETRKKDFTTSDGERFKISNSYSPVFGRMIVKEHPEVRPYIILHKSIVDELTD